MVPEANTASGSVFRGWGMCQVTFPNNLLLLICCQYAGNYGKDRRKIACLGLSDRWIGCGLDLTAIGFLKCNHELALVGVQDISNCRSSAKISELLPGRFPWDTGTPCGTQAMGIRYSIVMTPMFTFEVRQHHAYPFV